MFFYRIFRWQFPQELVYRVHPLPESLIDVVSDFGSLSEASEVVLFGLGIQGYQPQDLTMFAEQMRSPTLGIQS